MNDKKYLIALGERIRDLRKINGLTQLDLGLRCNTHAEAIGRIERGEVNPTVVTLTHIADALEIHVKDLVDFTA